MHTAEHGERDGFAGRPRCIQVQLCGCRSFAGPVVGRRLGDQMYALATVLCLSLSVADPRIKIRTQCRSAPNAPAMPCHPPCPDTSTCPHIRCPLIPRIRTRTLTRPTMDLHVPGPPPTDMKGLLPSLLLWSAYPNATGRRIARKLEMHSERRCGVLELRSSRLLVACHPEHRRLVLRARTYRTNAQVSTAAQSASAQNNMYHLHSTAWPPSCGRPWAAWWCACRRRCVVPSPTRTSAVSGQSQSRGSTI